MRIFLALVILLLFAITTDAAPCQCCKSCDCGFVSAPACPGGQCMKLQSVEIKQLTESEMRASLAAAKSPPVSDCSNGQCSAKHHPIKKVLKKIFHKHR